MIRCPNCPVLNNPIRNDCAKCGFDLTDIKAEWLKNNPTQEASEYPAEYSTEYFEEMDKKILEQFDKEKKEEQERKDSASLLNKGVNFSKSIVAHAANGFQKASNDIKNARIDICKQCELYNESDSTCKECGCYLEIKTSWASEKCPLGKWRAVEREKQQIQFSPLRSNPPKTCGGCGKKT